MCENLNSSFSGPQNAQRDETDQPNIETNDPNSSAEAQPASQEAMTTSRLPADVMSSCSECCGDSVPDAFSPGTEPDEEQGLTDWKQQLRSDFEVWLENLTPADFQAFRENHTDTNVGNEAPDLYTFFAQLLTSVTETRRSNRKTVEALNQWANTLAQVEELMLAAKNELALSRSRAEQSSELSDSFCLVLLELMDRMRRLERAFVTGPVRKWWQIGSGAWEQAWNTQRQGFKIIVAHFEELLEKAGVVRIQARGKLFDPSTMIATDTAADPSHADHMVIEEFAPGYRRGNTLLRPAQVRVNRIRNSAEPDEAHRISTI